MMSISDKKINGCGAHVEHRENVGVNCGDGINNKAMGGLKCHGGQPPAQKPRVVGVDRGGLTGAFRPHHEEGGADSHRGPQNSEEETRRFQHREWPSGSKGSCATDKFPGTVKVCGRSPNENMRGGGHHGKNRQPGRQGGDTPGRTSPELKARAKTRHDNRSHGDEVPGYKPCDDPQGDKPRDDKPRDDKPRDDKPQADKPRGDKRRGGNDEYHVRGNDPVGNKPCETKLCDGNTENAPCPRDDGSPRRDSCNDTHCCGGVVRGDQNACDRSPRVDRPPRDGGSPRKDRLRSGELHIEGPRSQGCYRPNGGRSVDDKPLEKLHDDFYPTQHRGAGPAAGQTCPHRGEPHYPGLRTVTSPSDEHSTRDDVPPHGGQFHPKDHDNRKCPRGGDCHHPDAYEITRLDGYVNCEVNRHRCQGDRFDAFPAESVEHPEEGRCSRSPADEGMLHGRGLGEGKPFNEGRRGGPGGAGSLHSVAERPKREGCHKDEPLEGEPQAFVPFQQTRNELHDNEPSCSSHPRGDRISKGKPGRVYCSGETPHGAKSGPRDGRPQERKTEARAD
jgi:hypothetical protein